jgi:hypothetical protein
MRQIKSQNAVMRVTDNPVDNIYRSQVMRRCLCATELHNSLFIAFDNHSPFATEELIHA